MDNQKQFSIDDLRNAFEAARETQFVKETFRPRLGAENDFEEKYENFEDWLESYLESTPDTIEMNKLQLDLIDAELNEDPEKWNSAFVDSIHSSDEFILQSEDYDEKFLQELKQAGTINK